MARDYHAYRSYGNEAPGRRASGGVLAGLIGNLKRALQAITRPTPSPVTLGKGGNKGYSTLGASSGHRHPADFPFPTAPANDANLHSNQR